MGRFMGVFHSRADVLVRTSDGRNCVIQEPIEYISDSGEAYRVPIGSTTDGASTLPPMWITLPPFGEYWIPSAIHDAAYRGTLEVYRDSHWLPAMLTKDESDSLFLEAMRTLRVPEETAQVLFRGVSLLGWRAFRDDRGQ